MKNTESLIIKQLKAGVEEAYRYLYKYHYASLCHIAKEYVNDPVLAESLVGDVIFHLWEIREKLNIQTSLRNYLCAAVRNRCLDYLSSRKVRNEIPFSDFFEEESLNDRYILSNDYPLGTLLERELENEIKAAIYRLPQECRRVFLKSRFENKKYEEIAQEYGISINTVKYHIKNALSILFKELGHYLSIFFIFL